MQRHVMNDLKTSELLCIPFLDTETSHLVEIADRVLHQRGYPAIAILLLRLFCAVGLWHQFVFLWDWASLDIWDVIQGYALLLVFVGLLTFYVSFVSALVCLAVGLAAFVGGFIGMRANRK